MIRRFFSLLGWIVAGLGLLVILSAIAVLGFPQQTLTIDSGEVGKVDALIVLGGGADEQRAARAAELFREGVAPVIIVTGNGDFEWNHETLLKHNVPDKAIILEPQALSTLENARFSIAILRKMGAHRAIIVTTWYHSRRSLACFQQSAPDLTFYSRPSYIGYDPGEWKWKGIEDEVRAEYLKLIGYWVCYRVSPF